MLRAAAASEVEEPGGFDGREKITIKKTQMPHCNGPRRWPASSQV